VVKAASPPTTAQPSGRWSGRLFLLLRPVDKPSGTIYGTLVGSSVLAAEGSKREGVGEIAVVVLVTLAVYWFAHGYSDMLPARAERISSDGRPHALRDLQQALRAEWPIVGGSLALVAVLLLAHLLGAGVNLSVDVALWFAVAEQAFWGLLAARAAQIRGWPMLLYGAGTAALGVVLTCLKVLLH
jgi:hypothetical protein